MAVTGDTASNVSRRLWLGKTGGLGPASGLLMFLALDCLCSSGSENAQQSRFGRRRDAGCSSARAVSLSFDS